MYVVPMNPNSVRISMVPNGCCKSSFDTTYPAQLHGVIQPNEFQQSIENINKSFKARKFMLIVLAVFLICILAGMALFIVGATTVTTSRSTSNLFIFIGVGMGIMVVGMIIMVVGSCVIQTRQMNRLRTAVAAESAKYSTRSPTPCSWRLDVTTSVAGYGRNRRAVRIYHLMIDIGRQPGAHGGPASYPYNPYPQPYGAPTQYGVPSAPPPYSAAPQTSFCGKCGAPRVNLTMKFCGSCGQAFS